MGKDSRKENDPREVKNPREGKDPKNGIVPRKLHIPEKGQPLWMERTSVRGYISGRGLTPGMRQFPGWISIDPRVGTDPKEEG